MSIIHMHRQYFQAFDRKLGYTSIYRPTFLCKFSVTKYLRCGIKIFRTYTQPRRYEIFSGQFSIIILQWEQKFVKTIAVKASQL